jgi:hypothetical protein
MRERLETILRAYIVACLASSCTVALAMSLITFVDLLIKGGRPAAPSVVLAPFMLLMLAGWATFFTLVLAFVPAFVVVGFAEGARIRVAAFYGIAGAATAVVCSGYYFRRGDAWFWTPSPAMQLTVDHALYGVLMLAGVIGGLAYWHIAGRSAGDWRYTPLPPVSRSM